MIERTEVDGVPAVVAHTSGPARAGLLFRVGQADETLAQRGITHLLEHLVLHPLGQADYHYNGSTGKVVTHFHLQGPVDAVTDFLASVCRSLQHLDDARIEIEKSIVSTEEGGRVVGPLDEMPLWRHGARDHGLTSFPQWGLRNVTAGDLREWAARYFTRGNAVLWFAGEKLPAGLKLDLPDGVRHPVPSPSSALPSTPAFFSGSSHATALDAVVRDRPASMVLAGVLERRLFRALRQEAGLSYTAATNYDPRGDGFAVLTALADALPGKQDAVLGGFLDVLTALRVGQIDDDVASVVIRATAALEGDDADAARLPGVAFQLLTDQPVVDRDHLVRELKAVDAAAVREVAVEALESALLMTPLGTTAEWAGFTAAPTGSTAAPPPAAGDQHHASGTDPADRLVVGLEHVSLVTPDRRATTVRFDNCAALLAYPDGGRLMVGDDAVSVRIEPTIHLGVDTAAVDARVPAQRRIAMPAREPGQIPQPRRPETTGTEVPPVRARQLDLKQKVTLGVFAVLTVVMGGVALAVSIAMAVGAVPLRPLPAIGVWIAAGYFARKLRTHWSES
ncbi:M16 family metallopeptidase [Micromonospora sp. NPDC000668]|uniref:M16 family metallopeptidase n=1 Tax=Micromonospora sp. NPDC000668 TaxID=3364219 RepID=UPI0036A9F972